MSPSDYIQHITLANGIELYHYAANFPISSFRVIYPVGSGHATSDNSFLPGEPHFLEHMLLQRSERWPQPKEITKVLGMKGGDENGMIYAEQMIFMIDIPAEHAKLGVEVLVDRLYRPVFDQSDIERERKVIQNERGQHEVFFPGSSPASKYYESEVLRNIYLTLDQRFGSPDDLAQHTVESMQKAQGRVISTEGVRLISVGSHSVDMVKQLFETPSRKSTQDLTLHVERASWVRPEFHVMHFEGVSDPTYEVEWLRNERPSQSEWVGLRAILQLMTNQVHGVFYQELRQEKGWAYDMDWNAELYPEEAHYGFYFPLNTMEEIEYVRSILFERIDQALQNQALVEAEVERRIANLAYGYQTSSDVAEAMVEDLRANGEIYTTEAWKQDLQQLLQPEYRKYLQEKFFTRESFGEIAFFPKEED